jgi:hypothetical protein
MTAHRDRTAQRAERRTGERMEILGDLRGEVMVYQPMAIRELAYGGAQVETAFPLQLDSLHELRLTLGEASVVVKGRVVHCSISDMNRELVTYRAGLEFIEVTLGVREAIGRFIETVRTGRLPQ